MILEDPSKLTWSDPAITVDESHRRHIREAQGSTDLIQTLLADDLVDQINMFIFPAVLGQDKKLFDAGSRAEAFRMITSRISPNGILLARYERNGAVKTRDLAMAHPPRPKSHVEKR